MTATRAELVDAMIRNEVGTTFEDRGASFDIEHLGAPTMDIQWDNPATVEASLPQSNAPLSIRDAAAACVNGAENVSGSAWRLFVRVDDVPFDAEKALLYHKFVRLV